MKPKTKKTTPVKKCIKKMTVLNRMALEPLLPFREIGFDVLIVSRSISKKLVLSVTELEKLKIKTDKNGAFPVTSDIALYKTEIEFSEREQELILETLEDARKNNPKLSMQFLDLYELFIS